MRPRFDVLNREMSLDSFAITRDSGNLASFADLKIANNSL
jgi:hypothetical protein